MGLIIILMGILILGIIIMKSDNCFWSDSLYYTGLTFIILSATGLFIIGVCLPCKHLEIEDFKAEYEIIKEMQTSSEDVRDATYTNKLIEINKKIIINRENIHNPFIGMLYSKEIANTELLNKE